MTYYVGDDDLFSGVADTLGVPVEREPAPKVTWPPRLAFDLALGLDSEEIILDRHMITAEQWEILKSNPLFLREVIERKKDLTDQGVTFRAKAKIQAEEYLLTIDALINDTTVDPKVRLEAIRSMVKWAGLEPKEDKEKATLNNAVQVNINI